MQIQFALLTHFECDGHTVHMLTQLCLPPPLTSPVKLSLFTHAHSSPLSLAVRLHQCCTIHSHYINRGWTFSGQMLQLSSHFINQGVEQLDNLCFGNQGMFGFRRIGANCNHYDGLNIIYVMSQCFSGGVNLISNTQFVLKN